ncbi:unnamed protein product [Owenia fusiformis]|uniref:Coronin n=1 Tax=Owenia fusiformis TaxID=6347 RepID=A0A8S4Q515_OWEFU|nr:unnamed protein product [Owenia fusiformis]
MPNKLTAASTPAPAVDKPRPTSTPMASKEPAKPAPVAAPTPVAAPAPVAAPTPVAAPEPAAAASAQAALPSSSKPVVESPKPAKPLIESKKPEITAAKPDAPKPSETNNTKDALIEKLIAKIEAMEVKSEAMEAKFEKQQSRITALEEKVAAQEADRHGELEMDNLVTENGLLLLTSRAMFDFETYIKIQIAFAGSKAPTLSLVIISSDLANHGSHNANIEEACFSSKCKRDNFISDQQECVLKMSRFVRESKFRHVFGTSLKKDGCYYDNIRITSSAWDSRFCAVNPKYIAIVTDGGRGSFLVLPLEKTGRSEINAPKVLGHAADVLDIAWCPFNDNMIASAAEDGTVKIWEIPENGLLVNLEKPLLELEYHQEPVGILVWHPTASNVLLSAGSSKVVIWNLDEGEVVTEIDFPDKCLSASFNPIGNLLATTCKDKMLRIVDPRTGIVVKERKIHEGSKPTRCAYLKDNKVFTTGFDRMSERQYALWDANNDLDELCMEKIDSANGVLFPFYDSDTNLIYIAGKGDSNFRYYELSAEAPYVHYLNTYQSKDPQKGMCMMPKRGVDVNTCEMTRFFKLHSKSFCEVITVTVPRKSELFQDDLYPNTQGDEPSVSAADWVSGVDAEPILISMKDKFVSKKKVEENGKKKRGLKFLKKSKAVSTPAAAVEKPMSSDQEAEKSLTKIEAMEAKFESMEAKFTTMEAAFKAMEERVKKQDKRTTALESLVAK